MLSCISLMVLSVAVCSKALHAAGVGLTNNFLSPLKWWWKIWWKYICCFVVTQLFLGLYQLVRDPGYWMCCISTLENIPSLCLASVMLIWVHWVTFLFCLLPTPLCLCPGFSVQSLVRVEQAALIFRIAVITFNLLPFPICCTPTLPLRRRNFPLISLEAPVTVEAVGSPPLLWLLPGLA